MEIVIAAVKSVVNKGVWRVVEAKGIVKGHFFLSLFFRGVLESGIFFAVDLPCQEGVSTGGSLYPLKGDSPNEDLHAVERRTEQRTALVPFFFLF